MDTETLTIPIAVANIVAGARVGVSFGLEPEVALDMAADNAKQTATDARTRGGIWASETTTRQIEDALFQGSVASDILDGTVERPSTGNVRAYALAQFTDRNAS